MTVTGKNQDHIQDIAWRGRIRIIYKTVHDGEESGSYIRQCTMGKNQDHI